MSLSYFKSIGCSYNHFTAVTYNYRKISCRGHSKCISVIVQASVQAFLAAAVNYTQKNVNTIGLYYNFMLFAINASKFTLVYCMWLRLVLEWSTSHGYVNGLSYIC